MKKIIAFTILIGLFLMGCKKSSPPSTTSSPTATVDIAADIAGTWIVNGTYYNSVDHIIINELLITKTSLNEVSISSPTSVFPAFTLNVIEDATGVQKYTCSRFPNFYISHNGTLVMMNVLPYASDPTKMFVLTGSK